jgi:hypothetical protein
MQQRLQTWMESTGDPLLAALQSRSDRRIVDQVMRETYGQRSAKRERGKK